MRKGKQMSVNLITQLVSFALNLGISFFLTPYVIEFIGKDVYTKDILNAIKQGNLKFSMSSPTQTNTGATAYLGFLSTHC